LEEESLEPTGKNPIYRGGVFTDLDGTLLDGDSKLSQRNASALRSASEGGLVRVAVTGRSLYSTGRALPVSTPLDYLVSSSGAAIYSWPECRLLAQHRITAAQVQYGVAALLEMGVDFKVFDPVPDNHCFSYHSSGVDNPDFAARLRRYSGFGRRFDSTATLGAATQLLVVSRPGDDTGLLHAELRRRFAAFNVVRATSPQDHDSMWFEIFPAEVSKGAGAEWLRLRLGLAAENCLAVGNDYNDLSLLKWCQNPYVVANAPEELRALFPVVSSNEEDGVACVLEPWVEQSRG
jgi:hydroxymethylpyrimidine pyrophosphatase-like HAD family hydrolase